MKEKETIQVIMIKTNSIFLDDQMDSLLSIISIFA